MVGRVRLIETRQEDDQSDAVGNDAATTPLEAKYYVDRTGVGCLAVSVSRINSGGSSKYNFSWLSKISQTVGIPLGVHGSAGYTDDPMRRMISFGAAKINYSAALLDIAAERIRDNLTAGALGYAATVAGVREAMQLETERCIQVRGSSSRAAEVLQQCRVRKSFAALAEKKV